MKTSEVYTAPEQPGRQGGFFMELTVNGELREVAEGATVAELLSRLGLAKQYVAVEVNRELIARTRHSECRLRAGDKVEIVTLVGGG